MNADADLHPEVVLEFALGWPFHGRSEYKRKLLNPLGLRLAASQIRASATARAHVFCRSSARHIIIVVLIRVDGLISIGERWQQEQRTSIELRSFSRAAEADRAFS